MINHCDNCPLRLFNKKCHNLQGVGNPFTGKLIILPNVDYDAYKQQDMSFSKQVEIITQHISSTGEQAETYILPLIRCNESLGYEVTEDIIIRCQEYLKQDFKIYDFKHIMLCGSAVNRFLHKSVKDLLDTIIVSSNNKLYYSNYSPLIKYVDKDKYDIFIHKLNEFIISSTYNDYGSYNMIKL